MSYSRFEKTLLHLLFLFVVVLYAVIVFFCGEWASVGCNFSEMAGCGGGLRSNSSEGV